MIGRLVTGDRLRWALPWAARRAARWVAPGARARPRHLLVALCDHFEPLHGGVPHAQGVARVQAWRERYPALAAEFRDDDGRPPRHSFFFPGEQYHPALVEPLAELCAAGLAEVEVHLHHDGDTRASLRPVLEQSLRDLASHGVVPEVGGRPRWAFIHGNWALANARRDGRWCGVDDELDLLFELGCYADFTFPSSPDECQPRQTNALWYPEGDVRARRAHERGAPASVGSRRDDRLLLVTGPVALARRPGSPRVRIEASALTAKDPGTEARLRTWLDAHVHVQGRPEWGFVKLHTHGAPEREADSLLGAPQRGLHEALARLRGEGVSLHYVTAREMFNVALAAMDGLGGSPGDHRDYVVPPPSRATSG